VTLKDITSKRPGQRLAEFQLTGWLGLGVGDGQRRVAKVNTTDATVSTVIDRNFAENLPMNGRSFQSLIQLTPGVVVTTE